MFEVFTMFCACGNTLQMDYTTFRGHEMRTCSCCNSLYFDLPYEFDDLLLNDDGSFFKPDRDKKLVPVEKCLSFSDVQDYYKKLERYYASKKKNSNTR
jgi:hypothetical protein